MLFETYEVLPGMPTFATPKELSSRYWQSQFAILYIVNKNGEPQAACLPTTDNKVKAVWQKAGCKVLTPAEKAFGIVGSEEYNSWVRSIRV
jgi:hypothetical protein